MKKFAAFLTALALFCVCLVCVNATAGSKTELTSAQMGTWTNTYKYTSYDAITANLTKDTIPVFGSSEFNHGKKTKCHPKAVFRHQKLTPMLIGTKFSQSMTHTIELAAIAPKMKLKKAVFIVSPTWFTEDGARPEGFAMRFSESEYVAMLRNPNISNGLKMKIAKRTDALLRSEATVQKCARKYDSVYLYGTGNAADKLYCEARQKFIRQRDYSCVTSAMKVSHIQPGATKTVTSKVPDWKKLEKEGTVYAMKKSKNNKFFMYNSYFNKKFKPHMKKMKGKDEKRLFAKSPEYSDLNCFLEVCKQSGIKPMLVILPLNKYWYDYTKLPMKNRLTVAAKVKKMAKKYGAEVQDLTSEGSTKYFMQDTVHLSAKGWVSVDESIYNFYKEGI